MKTDFQVSDGFVIKTYAVPPNLPTIQTFPELFSNGSEPVTDSSDAVANSSTAKDVVPVAVYLVEPRRASSAVLKFSGTIGQQNRMDKRSATITAFSHFVLHSTACQYMFADIQGGCCYFRAGRSFNNAI